MPTEKPDGYYGVVTERTMCEVLEEMRACHETRNYAGILGLIEEVQSMGNNMEAKLRTYNNVSLGAEYMQSLKDSIRKLKQEEKDLEASRYLKAHLASRAGRE